MSEEKLKELERTIVNLDIEKAPTLCRELLASNMAADKIFHSISQAMNVVGGKYEAGEYFLSELIMAGEVAKDVLRILEPRYRRSEKEYVGRVVLATVRGDLHDIGKNIVGMLLQSSGFRVHDVGIDVPTERIVEAVREGNAQIVGLSALLTTTVPEIEKVIKELEKAGMREKVKVIVGGAALNQGVARRYGADGYGTTAVDGLKICREWMLG